LSQPHIRTFLIVSAAFLALEAGPVVASINARQSLVQQREGKGQAEDALLTAWMPGQLFDFPAAYKSRRDCD
jgi:hypothetical protein